MEPDEILVELKYKLNKASQQLTQTARERRGNLKEMHRLHGKREGVELALSYIIDLEKMK